MYIKHNVPASVMLKLPHALNNPIGILKSSGKAKQQGFVFVTDLQENGKPLIIAVNRETLPNTYITIEIKSAYGKELSGFQNMLNYDILCWDYNKAERFEQIYSGILDLPPHIYPTLNFGQNKRLPLNTDSHSPLHSGYDYYYQHESLYVDYDKTERYLSQYFSDLSVNPNLYLDAEKVQQVKEWTRQTAPLTPKEAQTQMMSVYAEFIPENSEAYKDTEKRVEQQVATHYKQGKTLTPQDIQQVRENFTQKMPQVRQDYHQAVAKQQTQSTLPENITQQNQDNSVKNTTQNNSGCLKC